MATKNFLQPEPLTTEQNDHMVYMALKTFDGPQVNLHDAAAVRERIELYFEECRRLQLRPGNLGLYAFLGMTKQDVSDVLRGANKSRVSPEVIDLLKKAKLALSSFREQLAFYGKVNPVVALFWGKNFDGMTDTQVLEVSRNDQLSGLTASRTPEEIAEIISKDIPIDEPDPEGTGL